MATNFFLLKKTISTCVPKIEQNRLNGSRVIANIRIHKKQNGRKDGGHLVFTLELFFGFCKSLFTYTH